MVKGSGLIPLPLDHKKEETMKVHELAKKHGIESKEMLAVLNDLGFKAESHLSSVDNAAEMAVNEKLTPKPESAESEKVAEPVFFISKGRYFGIENMVPEVKWPNGDVRYPSRGIQFENWGYITSDVKEIEFLEKTNEFRQGTVRRGTSADLETERMKRMPIMREIMGSEPSIAEQSLLKINESAN